MEQLRARIVARVLCELIGVLIASPVALLVALWGMQSSALDHTENVMEGVSGPRGSESDKTTTTRQRKQARNMKKWLKTIDRNMKTDCEIF